MTNAVLSKLPKGFFAFLCVGTIGFAVDAAILTYLVTGKGWDHYSARLVSFGAAVFVTWLLNRQWTFRHSATDNKTREYSAYLTVQIIGALLNFAIYSACIFAVEWFQNFPVIPLAIASLIAAFFNYYGSRRYAFTGISETESG